MGRPSLLASSRPPPPRPPRASRLRLLRRHSRRNEMLSRGNLHMGIKLRNLKILPYNPGVRNFGGFRAFGGFLKSACTSIVKSFVGYLKHSFLVAPSLIRPLLFCIIRPIRVAKAIFVNKPGLVYLLSNISHVL